MKKTLFILPLLLVQLFTGCVQHVQEIPLTQLQIREMQSREFDTQDVKLVTKTVMNVLQDEGFIIKNAVLDLGLINAERYSDIENPSEARMSVFFEGKNARWNKQLIFEASANISEYGKRTRVRINFQTKKIDNLGAPVEVSTVLDSAEYQNFFEMVRKGLFIQQEDI